MDSNNAGKAFAEEKKEEKLLPSSINAYVPDSKSYIVASITDSMGNNPVAKCDGNKGLSSSEFQPVLNGTLYIGVCPFYNGYIIGQYFSILTTKQLPMSLK